MAGGSARRAVAASALALLAAPSAASAQTANDAHWDLQWGPQQVRAPEAWPISRGAGATIAIVDSGIDLDHPDLSDRIVGGTTFVCAGAPVRECGDGDWQSGDADGGQGHPHGTHVAGIAAATADNGVGVAGVAPEAGLLAVKVQDHTNFGLFRDWAAAIRWSADNGADVINLSVGDAAPDQLSAARALMQEAVDYARGKDVVVVAAAHNEFVLPCSTPGSADGTLCVAATDRNEARASYSNFALKPSYEAVAAPGGDALGNYEAAKTELGVYEEVGRGPGNLCRGDVVSTFPIVPADELSACERAEGTPGYGFLGGTSMAAPHVAGVAALLAAQGRDDDEIMRVLQETARTPGVEEPGLYTPLYGKGIVDAAAAVARPLAAAASLSPPAASAAPCARRCRACGRRC